MRKVKRYVKPVSKYLSLKTLRDIRDNGYRSKDCLEDYEPSEVESMILYKEDKANALETDNYLRQLEDLEDESEVMSFAEIKNGLDKPLPF